MTADITFKIAEMLRQTNPNLESRIADQFEALRETPCINSLLSEWIDENDVKYLLSALALNDRDFSEVFPEISYVRKQERQMLIEIFEMHFNECPHCSLKRGYDYEHDARIKKICMQNKDALLQMLDEEETASEGEHQTLDESSTNSSKQENQKFYAHP